MRSVTSRPASEVEKIVQGVAHGELTRRQFVERAVALGLSLTAVATILAACGEEEADTGASPAPMDTTLPEEINIFNWSDYMSPQCLKDFEAEYGIKVRETFYDGNEALFAKMRAGATGYDVIFPTDMWVTVLRKSDLIQPLDMELHPELQVRHRPGLPEADLRQPGRAGRQEVLGALHVRHHRLRGAPRQGPRTAEQLGPALGRGAGRARSRCSTRRARPSASASSSRASRPTRPARRSSTPARRRASTRSRWCSSTTPPTRAAASSRGCR